MAAIESHTIAAPSHYVWWFPGAPVRIHLLLSVIRRLTKQLQATGPKPLGQGLLFGSVSEGVTEVLDFHPVAENIPQTVNEFVKDGANGLLVGYYRIETGASLRLSESDLSLARTTFAKPYHVFLIIQPSAFGPPNAGFFFHDGEGKMAEFSLMEFPFEPSLLVDEERNRLKRSQEAAVRRAAAVQPPPPQPPATPQRRVGRVGRVLVVAVALLGSMVCGAVIWVKGHSLLVWWSQLQARIAPAPAQHPTQTLSALSMGLRAKRENGDLNITWSRESPVVEAATSGILTIKDGGATRAIALDAAQVHYSSVVYSPSSEQVSIQLSISTPVSTVLETVMLFLPREELAKPSISSVPQSSPARPLKFFAPPSAARRPSDPVLPDIPPLTPGLNASVNPDSLPVLAVQPRLAELPARSTVQAAVNPVDNQASYHPAEPLKRVVPHLPALLLQTIVSPKKIPIRVAIDETGRVTRAEPASNFSIQKILLDKLLEAARSWTFKPARHGDTPIPSEFVLEFTFRR